MKKIWKSVAVVCAALTVLGLTACGQPEKEIINAYDIAVKNGFVGTEQEWLQSLKGENGADGEDLDILKVYEASGFEGTLLEFIKQYLSVDVQENNDVKTIAENVTSVVSIYCGFTKTTSAGAWWQPVETTPYSAAGSGVIIDLNKQAGNALIVTNYHVIYDADSDTETGISDDIYLYTYGALNGFSVTDKNTFQDEKGDGIKATYVGGAMDYDIALLKVEGSEYLQKAEVTEARIGDSNAVQLGEKVFVVGNPDGAGISVTGGLISVESEYITMESTDGASREVDYRVMRTDAAINSGNSGGAMFNALGELIGITNAKRVSNGVDNMGYALPITQVCALRDNILANGGFVSRAMLGIGVSKIGSEAYYEDNGKLAIREKVAVAQEAATGAAAFGKLNYGDELQSITVIPNGQASGRTTKITRQHLLNDSLLTVRKGDTVILSVVRDGVEQQITIVYDKDSYFTKFA